MKKIIPLLVILAVVAVACTGGQTESPAAAPEKVSKLSVTSTTKEIKSAGDTMKNTKVMLTTNKGTIEIELYDDKAPITAANFKELVGRKFYDGLTFHRYEPGFVIQGGDPSGDGTGGSEQKIKLEIHPDLKHIKGAVAMARTQDPNSATSQFYITLAPTPFLDGQYAVFGRVTGGMDVVEQLRAGDVMEKVYISP